MWCDVGQSCAMMGLQATSGKRKLDGGVGCMDFDMELGESPSKLGRVEGSWWAMEESYASSSPPALSQTISTAYYDMEVVAASCLHSTTPNNPCHLSQMHNASGSPTTPVTASSTGLNGSSSPVISSQQTSSSNQSQHQQQQHNSPHNQQQQQHQHQSSQHYYQRASSPVNSHYQQQQQLSRPQVQWGHHSSAPHHYEPPTIRREENGKSYLELGSSYRANERCCEGSRSSWCRRGRACYRQRRLAVLNISMCKLARYRQFPDPSLHRSVLICNTLRHLEREMERDRSPPPMEPVMTAPMAQLQPTEQGRLTPFPIPATSSAETDVDSGIGDSDDSRSINWGSVLSLSSQSPLDPLNNNELLDVDIGPELDLDFIPGWKLTPAASANSDELLRGLSSSSNESSLVQQQQHQHQHQHQQQQQHSQHHGHQQLQACQQPQQQHHHIHHHHHHHHLHHHHHQGSVTGSCNNASVAASSSSSSTHESLMCVGS